MTNWNETLLEASKANNLTALREAIENGADLNVRNADQSTPLILAVAASNVDAAKMLLEAGAETDIQNHKSNTALILAANQGDTEIVRDLLGAGADVNISTNQKDSPLILASARGHQEATRLLLAAGAETDLINDNKSPALYYAAAHGHAQVVDDLLAAGAKTDIRAIKGKTPLIIAVEKNHKPVVRSLLGADADIRIKDDDGKTALDRATNPTINYGNVRYTRDREKIKKRTYKEYSDLKKTMEQAEQGHRPVTVQQGIESVNEAAIGNARVELEQARPEWDRIRSAAIAERRELGFAVPDDAPDAAAAEAETETESAASKQVFGMHTRRVLEKNQTLRRENNALETLATHTMKDKFFAELAYRKGWGPEEAGALEEANVVLTRHYEDGPVPKWQAEFSVGPDAQGEGLHQTFDKMAEQMRSELPSIRIASDGDRRTIQTGFCDDVNSIITAFNTVLTEDIGVIDSRELHAAAKAEAQQKHAQQRPTDLAR